MTHDGQSAARVSGACFAMGEAAGVAAALALGGNTMPRDIAVDKLQEQLKQQGAFIGRDQAVPEGLMNCVPSLERKRGHACSTGIDAGASQNLSWAGMSRDALA